MDSVGCKELLGHLDALLEGEGRSAADGHLRDCPSCRSLVEDLQAIRKAARGLATLDAEPPARVWASLRVRLEEEGLIGQGRRGWLADVRGWLGAMPWRLSRPALAGASLVALLALGFALSRPFETRLNGSRWTRSTQRSTMLLNAQLNAPEVRTDSVLATFNPVVAASYQRNLALVDNYIQLCEKSVREDPENELARDYLYDAYQQKANLLTQMSEPGDYGR